MKKKQFNNNQDSKTVSIKKISFYLSFIVIVFLIMANTKFLKKTTLKVNYEKLLVFDNYFGLKTIDQNPKRYRNAYKLNLPLNASASAQPNLSDLKTIIKKTNLNSKQVYIIDLRQEPHGFLNEYAVSWYGFRNQLPNSVEKKLIKELANKKIVKVYKNLNKLNDGHVNPKEHKTIKVKQVLTEKDLVEKLLNSNYKRILVTDHFAPQESQVDLFVKFIKTLPQNSWLHFHCRGGKGRSTTFMVMYDIIKHAKDLSLKDILNRQHKIGGSNLSKNNHSLSRSKWKEAPSAERYHFIKIFYMYVIDPNGYNSCTWSEWLRKTI
jgi:protein tyrosine phosphatase